MTRGVKPGRRPLAGVSSAWVKTPTPTLGSGTCGFCHPLRPAWLGPWQSTLLRTCRPTSRDCGHIPTWADPGLGSRPIQSCQRVALG